jgi:uncharacterized alpha-E superfamily protein
MLSRVAEAVYWMTRYMERAENVARFVDVTLNLELDLPAGAGAQWSALLATTGDEALFRERYGEPTRESVMHFLTFDADYPSSILACVRASRENARSVREIISSEMWEQANKAYLMVTAAASRERALDMPHELFDAVKLASQTFMGITYLTMTHNEAWHFGRLGRLLERADKTTRILDVKYLLLAPEASAAHDDVLWVSFLKSVSAFEMYRKRYGLIVPARVAQFLLLDDEFPRAVRSCVAKAERSLNIITGAPRGEGGTSAERRLRDLRKSLATADVEAVISGGMHDYLDRLQSDLFGAGDAIHASFFETSNAIEMPGQSQ